MLDSTSIWAVKRIKIGARHRRDLGDVDALARSIEAVGLLHPVVVRPDGVLIAGERRLAAARALGWAEVPVRVVDLAEVVLGERAENFERKDFTPHEMVQIGRAVEEVERAASRERQREGGRAKGSGKFPEAAETRDKVAAFLGVSGRTYEKARAVVEAAEAEPEKFGPLVDEMERTGKVTGAHRKLKKARDEQRILGLSPVKGKFRTLVVDPPWDYEWLSLAGRAAPGYATMTHEEIAAVPVPAWAGESCHLYLWTTNNFMTRAVDLMARWGFAHKTVLTWVKPEIGLGSYFRNSTEHVLFGVVGEVGTRPAARSIPTHFFAPLGEHSAKPEEFYEIVRKASYPAYGEAFQRDPREDFKGLFER